MSRRRLPDEPLKHEAWAIPYADLMTLMLAFFVVLYAVAMVHQKGSGKDGDAPVAAAPFQLPPIPWRHVAAPSIAPPRMAIQISPWAGQAPASAKAPHRPEPASALRQIHDQLAVELAPLIRQHQVVMEQNSRWLKIELRSDILFPSGVAELSPSAREVLDRIAAVLRPFDNPLRVEGYADDRPIHTAAFPSNWELSAARAGSVARLFSEQGLDSSRLGILGWGSSKPIAPNSTLQGRHRNRRVLLVVLSNHLGLDTQALPYADSQTLPATSPP